MKYILNQKKFNGLLLKGGYESLLDFCRKTSIHRNTVQVYLNKKDVFSSAFLNICSALKSDPLDLIIPTSESKASIANMDEISIIIGALVKQNPGLAILLLGSRAKGREKRYSDWDIGITAGDKPLTGSEYLQLRGMVEDLADDLPRSVQLIDLDAAPLWFLEGIDYDPIFIDGSRESYLYFTGVLDGIRKKRKTG